MQDAKRRVIDLVFGRWRSRTLYAGVELGVFEIVGGYPKHAVEIADLLDVDREFGYRLLRALGSMGLLEETSDRRFSLTPAGELLREDHPESLRGVVRLEEGPTRYALWKHLPEIVREGGPHAFDREFGHSVSEHRETSPAYADVFDDGMTGYSKMESAGALELLDGFDFSDVSHVCEVAGGRGHLLCSLLAEHPHLEGTVLERPDIVEESDRLWAPKMGVDDRCTYLAGDVFEAVPEADVYVMKNVLHGYDDEECAQILSTVRESAPVDARLFVVGRIVSGPGESSFANLFDVHTMVTTTGRERTAEEYADLLAETGWAYVDTRYPENELVGAVEAVPD